MKIAGIITEYNPFHNGHLFHLNETRRITSADYVIAVMSPDYTQRGIPACLDKHTRTAMALAAGVDLVLELPLAYATGSAEYFATGAISMLDQLQAVSHCCFGSETGHLAPFSQVTEVLIREPELYTRELKTQIKSGQTYPAARNRALLSYFDQQSPNDCWDWTSFLSTPNNILGIEYCKAITRLESTIQPVTIKRAGDQYHEQKLSSPLSSATAIRASLLETNTATTVQSYLPPQVFAILADHWPKGGLITENDFSLQLRYRLMSETPDSLCRFLDVSQSMANRIYNHLNDYKSFSQFASLLKSKEMTHTRINRMLLHILLNIQQPDPITYARILGFKKSSTPLLTALKKASSIPLVSKLNEQQYDAFAANLYETVRADKYQQSFRHEFTKPVVIVP